MVPYGLTSHKLTIICSVHGAFEQLPSNHLNGKGCSRCNLSGESKLFACLKEKVEVVKSLTLKTGKSWRFYDFFLPAHNLLIELDGEQHYPAQWNKENNLFSKGRHSANSLEWQQKNDKRKTKLAKNEGYEIARIPYWVKGKNIEIEVDNILRGKPTYPDVPDPTQEKDRPKPTI